MSTNHQHDVDLVEKAVMTYIDGVVNFEFDKGVSPWHKSGVKISFDKLDNSLVMKTINETRPNWKGEQLEDMKKRISQNGKIESIDVTGNAGFVKLVWDFMRDEVKQKITDYILLLKIEEEWKIVGKVFNEEVIQS